MTRIQFQLAHDTAANWTANNPTLASGEMGVETDTLKVKVGNGSTAWNSLAYLGGGSGTVTSVSVVSTNGFSGSVATPTATPAITIQCSLAAGLVKSNGSGALVLATAGTDFLTPTGSAAGLTGLLSAQVTGALGFTPYNATNPSGYITGITQAMWHTALGITPGAAAFLHWNGAAWEMSNPAGSGTVTSVSVVSANGFGGTVATATSTPAITLTTSVTGLLKGNGTGVSAAVAGTDYVAPGGALGTPSSGTLTNCGGTAASLTAGLAQGLTGTPAITVGVVTAATGSTVAGASGDIAFNVQANSTGGGAAVWVQSGNGTTSSKYAYMSVKASQTSPQEWRMGLYGTTSWRLFDATAGSTLLSVEPATGNMVCNGSGTFNGGVVPNVSAPSWSSTMTLTTAGEDRIRITLGGATTLNFNAGSDGQKLTLELIQDSGGSKTVTWGTGVVFGTDIPSITLTTTANKRDIIGLLYTTGVGWMVVGYARGF